MQRRSSFKALWVIYMLSKSLSTTTCQYLVYAMWKIHALSFNLGEMQTNYCQGFLYYASFVKFVRQEKLA